MRWKNNSKSAAVLLRGSDKAAISIDASAKTSAKRGWTRYEGVLRGNQLSLSMNGESLFKDREITDLPKQGPLKIVPQGPIDFANLYIRSLKD